MAPYRSDGDTLNQRRMGAFCTLNPAYLCVLCGYSGPCRSGSLCHSMASLESRAPARLRLASAFFDADDRIGVGIRGHF